MNPNSFASEENYTFHYYILFGNSQNSHLEQRRNSLLSNVYMISLSLSLRRLYMDQKTCRHQIYNYQCFVMCSTSYKIRIKMHMVRKICTELHNISEASFANVCTIGRKHDIHILMETELEKCMYILCGHIFFC